MVDIHDRYLLNLKVLSDFARYDISERRLHVYNGTLVIEPVSWYVSIRRTLYGESRKCTISFCNELFVCILIYIRMLKNTIYLHPSMRTGSTLQLQKSEHIKNTLREIACEVEPAIDGLRNLQQLYNDDCTTRGQISLLINKAHRILVVIAEVIGEDTPVVSDKHDDG